MSGHLNRGRLSAIIGGPWRLYTHPIRNWQMLGTVQIGMEIGALGLSLCGIYAMLNAGAVRSLNQRKVKAALLLDTQGSEGQSD